MVKHNLRKPETDDYKEMMERKYLEASDIPEAGCQLTIDNFGFQEMQDIQKPNDTVEKGTILFKETDLGMVLNKTKLYTLGILHGTVMSKWIGKQIILQRGWIRVGKLFQLGIIIQIDDKLINESTLPAKKKQLLMKAQKSIDAAKGK